MEQIFNIGETGTAIVAPVVSSRKKFANQEILLAISDPNVSVGEVSRLITIEIATVYDRMADSMDDPTATHQLKALKDQISVLRDLQNSLKESDILSKKDVLNFDGEKFKFVLVELFGFFQQSLKDSGLEESFAKNVMKQFSDILKVKEDKLRKDTAKIG